MSGTNALLTVTAHDRRIERSVLWDCFAKILSTGIYSSSSIFRILSVSVESARLMYIFAHAFFFFSVAKVGLKRSTGVRLVVRAFRYHRVGLAPGWRTMAPTGTCPNLDGGFCRRFFM